MSKQSRNLVAGTDLFRFPSCVRKFIEIKGNLCQLWYYYLGNPLLTAKGRTIVKTLTREAWFKRKLIAALGY